MTSVVICHNFIFLQWRLTGAIAAQVLQSHLYFYFLTFGRSEQVLGQSMSKENIKLRDYSGDNYRESAISRVPVNPVILTIASVAALNSRHWLLKSN
ncbi:hypothetical protein [Microcystis aeruginosa]|uniref:hypothetical protein n=1 Tax=Microcystis aeruginosa TaxID=1126 RepID=UPI00123138FA|nr:hypothetical protein [Microcystis aeruginosa]